MIWWTPPAAALKAVDPPQQGYTLNCNAFGSFGMSINIGIVKHVHVFLCLGQSHTGKMTVVTMQSFHGLAEK